MNPQQLSRMPAAFIGHGSPMNALENNAYSNAWRTFGRMFGPVIPRPNAILAISAHWYVRGLGVTAMEQPKTIHDFGDFPQALFDMQYPAAGSPTLAMRIQELLQPLNVQLDRSWGLDHGTWSILVHMFPDADVPVAQLSIDATQPLQYHYDVGRQLGALRDEGVLILGSGNVVHNLRAMHFDAAPYSWATTFNDRVKTCITNDTHQPLIDYPSAGEAAQLSIPTPEHYLPLLYILGAQRAGENATILVDGIELSSISMLSVVMGT